MQVKKKRNVLILVESIMVGEFRIKVFLRNKIGTQDKIYKTVNKNKGRVNLKKLYMDSHSKIQYFNLNSYDIIST